MLKYFFLLILIFNNISYSVLSDHLKKADGKSASHSMRNIDFIYMINLDKRPEKFLQSFLSLSPYGINPYRFSAVNGWELSLEAINDIGLQYLPNMTSLFATSYPLEAEGKTSHGFMSSEGQAYFTHGMTRGTIGCSLSHISILKDALDSGYETIWVMEDDIEPVKDPLILSELIDRLDALVGKDNWDVLFTDQDYRGPNGQYISAYGAVKRPDMDSSHAERYSEKYTMNQKIDENFKKITARFATHSMIIRRSGIKKLLQFSLDHKVFLPYDLENYLVPGINRYSLCYDVVTNLINAKTDNATSEP